MQGQVDNAPQLPVHPLNDLGANGNMLLRESSFVGGERPGLQQNRIRYANFADVVERSESEHLAE